MRNLFLFTLLVTGLTIRGQAIQDERDEVEELRTMLRQSKSQNKKLEQKMDRLKLVWSALSQMCQTLAQPECGCEVDSATRTTNETEPEKTSALRVLSAKSSRKHANTVRMTVTFTALEKHVTDWIAIYSNREQIAHNTYRIDGERTSKGLGRYSSSAVFTHPDWVKQIWLQIYSGTETVSLLFEADDIMKEFEQILPDYNTDYYFMNYTYTAPIKGNLDIHVVVKGDVLMFSPMHSTHIFFTGVNASSNPPSVFEVYDTGSGVSIERKLDSAMTITLQESVIQWGGLFVIRLPQKQLSKEYRKGDLIKSLLHGYIVEIRSADSGEIVPKNTVGLLETENMTVVAPVASITCFAMGSPTPDIDVYRVLKDGRRKKLRGTSIKYDDYTVVVTYKLIPEEKNIDGLYVCRAESGTAVAEEFRNVEVFERVKFDETKTGLVKNTTDKIVFRCKVTSKLKPKLEFRLFDKYGAVIQPNDQYKISAVQTGKRTSRITLSISPPDKRLYNIDCVARTKYMEEVKKIEMFPRDESFWVDYWISSSDSLGNLTMPLI